MYFFTKGLVGKAYIELKSTGEAIIDPETGRPFKYIPTDRVGTLPTVHKGSGMMPDELGPALKGLAELTDKLNALLEPESEPAVVPTTSQATTAGAPKLPPVPPGLKGVAVRLNRTLDALYTVLGDAENQTNLKTSFANLAEATAKASDAMKALQEFAVEAKKAATEANQVVKGVAKLTDDAGRHIEELMKKLIEDAEKVSKLMDTINKVALKLESGEGSAGLLLNDPKLYNNLVQATEQMSVLMKDFSKLLKEWKEKGVKFEM